MKRIAIASTQGNNYGGRLQNYALRFVIKRLYGDNVVVDSLRFAYGRNPIYPNIFSLLKEYTVLEFLKKIFEKYREKKTNKIKDKLVKRFALFAEFNKSYIEIGSVFYKYDEHSKMLEQYDVLVCGSDQVWNPNLSNRVFLGDLPCIKKKISYGASIGRGYLSEYETKYMLPRVSNFNAISVREKSAKKILDDYGVNKDVKVVLDPTMLLSQEEWSNLASERMIAESYVLMYSFSDCQLKYKICDYYKSLNKRVVFIPYPKQKYNEYDANCPMFPIYDAGPKEFLSLFRYADVIYTDSFHGTVFSILFNKEFYVYERNKCGQTSMNSRLYDLLEMFNLKSRLITSDLNINNNNIDYKFVNEELENKRQDSIMWLNLQLNND